MRLPWVSRKALEEAETETVVAQSQADYWLEEYTALLADLQTALTLSADRLPPVLRNLISAASSKLPAGS